MKKKNNDNNISFFKKRFKPDINTGLNSEEIQIRIKEGDLNKTPNNSGKSYGKIIFDNIFTFFNIMMFTIGMMFIFIVGPSAIGNLSFLVIVISNLLIGTIQECKSKRTIDKLKLVNTPRVTVVRNGKREDILPDEIVLDDVVILSAGDQIPADCIIINGSAEVNESLLTGESTAIKKSTGDLVLSGSFVISGNIICAADRVGINTYIYSIESKSKEFKKPKSKLMTEITGIIKKMTPIVLPLGIVVFWKEYVVGLDLPGSVISGGTSIIGMIPAGLILVASIAMATGVVKLANNNALVQDLYSVESLARVDTLCLDKTGTLTDGTMTVENVIELTLDNIDDIMSDYLGAFSNENQTSKALIKYFGRTSNRKIINKVEFSSIRKYSAVEFEDIGTYALGAPEYLTDDREILEKTLEYAKKGIRVIALVKVNSPIKQDDSISKRRNIVSLFLIRDTIRPEVKETMKWFSKNQVDIRVISGDNVSTVQYIAKESGISNWERALDMSKINMNDPYIEKIIMETTIFGRVSPEQKAFIVEILKKNGRTVSITGDGVNDILAMKASDCAIALANGSPATKNIANIVLLDSNFSNMPLAVYEGRRVVNNIQRSSSLFLMKNLFFMLLSIFSILSGLNFPVETSVMGLVNFFITGIGCLLLSIEPSTSRISGNFTKNVFGKAIPAGFFMFLPVFFMFILTFFRVGISLEAVNEYISTLVPAISLCLTIAGFVVFFNISRPFTKFRSILYTCTLAIVILMILAVPEIFLNNSTQFWGEILGKYGNIMDAFGAILRSLFTLELFKTFSSEMWIVVLGFLVLGFPLYIIVNLCINKLMDKK